MFFILDEVLFSALNWCSKGAIFLGVQSLIIQRARLLSFSLTFLLGCLVPGSQAAAQDRPSSATTSVAQSTSKQPVYNISIGETLKDFMVSELSGLDETVWEILRKGENLVEGRGRELANYVFAEAGVYTIRFTREHEPTHTGGCDHYHMPASVTVKVNPQGIVYLGETLTTSEPIKGGVPTDNIFLSISVRITGKKVNIPKEIESIGVETSIKGKLTCKSTLNKGEHTLTYKLSGQGLAGTYIMFNFRDVNGNAENFSIKNQL